MAQLSPVVSLYNLNQVYTELDNRINSLNKIWDIKGTCTWEQLKQKTTADSGDIWNVSDADDWGIIGGNWAWTTTQPPEGIDYYMVASNKFWYRLGSILEYAETGGGSATPGVSYVYDKDGDETGLTSDALGHTGNSTPNTIGSITRGVLENNHILYTTIPAAGTTTYGVMTIGEQSFKGTKTFTDGVIIKGTIQTPGGSTPALAVTGKTEADSTKIGLLDVENTLSVTGADPAGDTAAKTGTLNVTGTLTVEDNTSNAATTGKLAVTSTTTVQNNLTTADLDITESGSKFTVTNNSASAASTDFLTVHNTISNAGTVVENNLTTKNLLVTTGANQVLSVTGTSTTDPVAVTDTLTVSNGILISGSNLNKTQWDTYLPDDPNHPGTKIINVPYGTVVAAIFKNMEVGGTAYIKDLYLRTPKNGVTNPAVNNDYDYYDLTVTSGVTVNSLSANELRLDPGSNGQLIIKNLNLYDDSDNTYKDLTVRSNVTLQSILCDNPSGLLTLHGTSHEIENLGVLGTATVTNLNTNTLTVTQDLIAAHVYGAQSGTAIPEVLITGGSVQANNLKLSADGGTTINRDLIISNTATVNTLTAPTATISTELQASTVTATDFNAPTITISTEAEADTLDASAGTISADQVTVTDVTTPLATVGTELKADILDTSTGTVSAGGVTATSVTTPTATIGTDLRAKILDVSNGTLAVTQSGTTTVTTLKVRTNIDSITNTNLLTLGNTYTTGNNYVFKELNNSAEPGRSTTSYRDQTVLKVYGGGWFAGGIEAVKVFNAVWNDLSDRIEIDCKPEPGYAYSFDGEHYHKTTKYADQGYIGIESDTAGIEMGGKNVELELNASVAGFVLAYVDKEYKSGTPLTCTKDGKLTKARWLLRITHPERIIATFWKKEIKKTFGPEGGAKQVNGRMWVKIK